jgi:uncharacterized membrane protein
MLRQPCTMTLVAALALAAVVQARSAGAQTEAAAGEGAAGRIDHVLHGIATAIEIAGVGIIVLAVLIASALFLRQGFRAPGWSEAYSCYRANLGRGILLGLELLVAADIIGTVAVTPSFQSLGVLALIVLIRTFLSFSLEVEIEGQWPWRRREMEGQSRGGERL